MTDWVTPDGLPLILVDTREQLPLVFSAHVRTERVTLVHGDYSVEGYTDRCIVERKSLPDLVACCGRERARFSTELAHLSRYRWRCVVVEGTMRQLYEMQQRGRLTPEQVWHSTVAFQQDWDVPFVWTGGPRAAAAWVEYYLLRVQRQGNKAAEMAEMAGKAGKDADSEAEESKPAA